MSCKSIFYLKANIMENAKMAENHINLNCESCGADLSIKKGEASVTCGFCSTLNKPTAENQSPTNKQKTMLFNAAESDNWEEVSKYATSILEEDPSDYEAWFYKGAAAGWTSRHIDDPSKEISNCFRNAFANSDDESLDAVLEMLGTKGVELLLALARGSRNFAQQHGYLNVGDMLHNSWRGDTMNGHISKVFGFIDSAFLLTQINRNERVAKLNPALDAVFLKLFAFLHTEVSFEGVMTKKNPFNLIASTFTFVFDPDSDLGAKWTPRVDEILTAFKNSAYSDEDLGVYDLSEQDFSDPRHGDQQEAAAAGGGGGCFIATAVYEDDNHFNLIVLRSFRDNTLRRFYIGRKFIRLYYAHGPSLANGVKKSKTLKAFFTPLVELGVIIVKVFKIG
jgi:LSD1 subclass zinc finger protein